MAHCITVSKDAIRVQLPGGTLYAPAFSEAASKIGARSGLSKQKATALLKMVDASVVLLNSADATTIMLEMRIHDDSFSAKVIGTGGTAPTKKALASLTAVAGKRTSSFDHNATKTRRTISFVI